MLVPANFSGLYLRRSGVLLLSPLLALTSLTRRIIRRTIITCPPVDGNLSRTQERARQTTRFRWQVNNGAFCHRQRRVDKLSTSTRYFQGFRRRDSCTENRLTAYLSQSCSFAVAYSIMNRLDSLSRSTNKRISPIEAFEFRMQAILFLEAF